MLLPYILIFAILITKGHAFKRKSKFIAKIVIFLICFSLFPLFWTLRNSINLPADAMKGSRRAISTLTHGTYPDFIHKSQRFKYFPYREDPKQPEYSESLENFAKIFWHRFKQRPTRYLKWYFIEKPYYLWSWNILQGQGDVYVYPVKTSLYYTSWPADLTKKIIELIHPVILILTLLAIPLFGFQLRMQEHAFPGSLNLFIFVTVLYYTAIYTIFAPWPRYSVPLRPELYLLALWVIKTGMDIVRPIISRWKVQERKN
jgi:ABC-type maltose transport system permease subunit